MLHLDFGDIAFEGNGPDGKWFIGIEYKQMQDFVACMKDGRFVGTQLPGMLDDYDMCFLLLEGTPRMDAQSGHLYVYFGKDMSYPLAVTMSQWTNYKTSISLFTALGGKPCIILTSGNIQESVMAIRATYSYFQKPWEEHNSVGRPDETKLYRLPSMFLPIKEPVPGDPEYPKYMLRRMLFQIHRMGWETAGQIAERFGTVEALMAATQKEIIADGVGVTLANRIYVTLHGHEDPTLKKRRLKSKEDDAV